MDAAFGRYYRATEQSVDAVTAYDRAIAARPDIAGYHLGRGYALLWLERYGEADAAAARAIQLGSKANGQVLRATTFLAQRRYADARAAARAALDADPENRGAQEILRLLASR